MTDPADAIRAEVAEWIAGHWDPEMPLARCRELLADSGWACPALPRQWCCRARRAEVAAVATEALSSAVVPAPADGVGMILVAPVLIEHGSDELKRQFVRRTVTGEISWCQLFSEPGAGSDLAGLQTSAELDGDEWL